MYDIILRHSICRKGVTRVEMYKIVHCLEIRLE